MEEKHEQRMQWERTYVEGQDSLTEGCSFDIAKNCWKTCFEISINHKVMLVETEGWTSIPTADQMQSELHDWREWHGTD